MNERFDELERNFIGTPVREPKSFGGTATLSIPVVKELPALPETKFLLVFWTSEDGGSGDDQLWLGTPTGARWMPLANFTDKDGSGA